MEVLHPELRAIVSDLVLSKESRELLLEILVGGGKTVVPNDALRLVWLLERLRGGEIPAVVLIQKTHLLENLLNVMRQEHKEWVSKVCYILYEGTLSRQSFSYILPQGMIRDLLRWVNLERTDKAREILWSILLRKEVGLSTVAKILDVAAGLCEKDPIIRNNVIQFLFDHFSPDEVVESLFQYAMASGKRIPGVVFKRYASLLKDHEDQQQKKYILEKILSSAELDDKEIAQIFSDYMNSLNRFDLIRLFSTPGGSFTQIAELKGKGRQMSFPLDHGRTSYPHRNSFCKRISLMKKDPALSCAL
jgi:hypothetical protein